MNVKCKILSKCTYNLFSNWPGDQKNDNNDNNNNNTKVNEIIKEVNIELLDRSKNNVGNNSN